MHSADLDADADMHDCSLPSTTFFLCCQKMDDFDYFFKHSHPWLGTKMLLAHGENNTYHSFLSRFPFHIAPFSGGSMIIKSSFSTGIKEHNKKSVRKSCCMCVLWLMSVLLCFLLHRQQHFYLASCPG